MLQSLVCHIVQLREIEGRLRGWVIPHENAEMQKYKALVILQTQVARTVMNLQSKLRLTNQTRYNILAASTAIKNTPKKRLWEDEEEKEGS